MFGSESSLIPSEFNGSSIRQVFHKNQWWAVIVDCISACKVSSHPSAYWSERKKILLDEGAFEMLGKIQQLKVESSDGKKYKMDCATRKGLIRIMMTIKSPKLEPFRTKLADAYEEKLDRERSRGQMSFLPEPPKWSEERLLGIFARNGLTSVWKELGVTKGEYGVLTNIAHGILFDTNVKKHKEIISTEDNLRDALSTQAISMIARFEEIVVMLHCRNKPEDIDEIIFDVKEAAYATRAMMDIYEEVSGKSLLLSLKDKPMAQLLCS